MITIIINNAPYGNEKAYNALRITMEIMKKKQDVRLFLMDDGVFNGKSNQQTPDGYYNIERMLQAVIRNGGEVKSCGGCSNARGINELPFIEGVQLSNMKEFAQWTIECDKVLAF